MSFEQIVKFQCLKLSNTQGLSHGIFRTNVARVQKRVSKFANFKVQKVQKPELYGLTVNRVFLYTISAFGKYISPLWTNFLH